MDPKLEIDTLSRIIDGDRIVDAVSLTVAVGEVLAVVGPSGAGKSSFLRLLNRLDEPTEGMVRLDGMNYREIPPETLRIRVGYVPQRPALRDGTVGENVTIGPRLRGESIDDHRVEALLERVDLAGYASRTVENLSGGEAQRVAIARTFVTEPEVVLLDEPTASLDPKAETRVEKLLTDLITASDLTCVLVTHDREQARRLGDRIAVFEDGRVASIGDIGTVFT